MIHSIALESDFLMRNNGSHCWETEIGIQGCKEAQHMREGRKLQDYKILIAHELVLQDVCYFSNLYFQQEHPQNNQKAWETNGKLNMHAMIFQFLEMIVWSKSIWKTSGHFRELGPFGNFSSVVAWCQLAIMAIISLSSVVGRFQSAFTPVAFSFYHFCSLSQIAAHLVLKQSHYISVLQLFL